MTPPLPLLRQRSDGGFALVATIAILTLLCAVSAVVFASAMANFQVGVSDLEKSRTYYAAEGTCLRAGRLQQRGLAAFGHHG
ncbi:MAG TPA: hypothetical protein VJ997_05085 [Longimicrobiales bacterium]|nr:hypothetical protein [Longimicrobiales bacterium]